jgi:hypothetical protein
MWLSSAYAIEAEIRNGSLVEFLRARRRIEVNLYTLTRRSQSPLAKSITDGLRRHVKRLNE